MLERVLVGERVGVIEVGDDVHLAPVAPGRLGEVAGGHAGQQLARCAAIACARERLGGRDQHGRRVRPVLGLAQQVDRDDERVGVLVGDDQDLGRTGEQVDADLAEQLPLRLGDERVAGAGDQVHPVDRLGADRQRRDRLHAAEQVDLVGARQMHCRDGGGGDLAADRRRRGDDPLDAGDLGRDDGHVRARRAAGSDRPGCRPRPLASARCFCPSSTPGSVSISKSLIEASCRSAIARTCCCTNRMSSITWLRHVRHDLLDLRCQSRKLSGDQRVELLGVLAHGGIPALPDVGDDALHGRLHLCSASAGRAACVGVLENDRSGRHAVSV